MAQPPQPNRSQSSTSLSRLYNGPNSLGRAEDNDPALDFCNSFWGPGDKGYEVLMARLRGATRTIDEIRAFWKERIAIEEEYAKKLAKLSKTTVGRDEIGDLQGCLKHVLNETGQQASYHAALSQELRESVEGPTAEFGNRLVNLRKGLQGSVEKSYKNKGLQEGHVNKAKERYESDCLKLNSYTANINLVQGKELERIQQKLGKVQQTIGANEQDFRQFVKVTEGTVNKWEGEWKSFCDDLEEDRLAMTKDIIWAYANAVSQVCVEDDGSCERIREKLEQFEPQNDMVTFVRGWGTGDSIPDPPRFINYAAGEVFSSHPTSHPARFERISSKPPGSAQPPQSHQTQQSEAIPLQHQPEPIREERNIAPPIAPPNGEPQTGTPDVRNLNINDAPRTTSPEQQQKPFGGVALPGLAAAPVPAQALPDRRSSMGPPPLPSSTMSMPEPRTPSRQSQVVNNAMDEEDPMVRALANLRKEPPPPDSIRRNPSNRRTDSMYSNQGSVRNGIHAPASPGPGAGAFRGAPSPGPGQYKSPSSPAPGSQPNNRASYQQPPQGRGSIDMGLSPPPGGHTAAALAKSMDEFHRQSSRDQRQSVNYSSFAEDIVGQHPSSRPASPAATSAARAPSPAMMQAPRQPETHIADEVLSQYHQAFPGERQSRSRAGSRAGSIRSGRSRAGSVNTQAPPAGGQQPPPSPGRQGFAGIGAGGGRSPSPQPGAFRSPSPGPQAGQGALGPQNLGITLDEKGGVAHDSMAEAYRRQYQQSQQDGQPGGYGPGPGRPTSAYGGSQVGYGGAPSAQSHGHQQPSQQQGQPYGGQMAQQNQYQRSSSPAPPAAQQSTQYFPAYSPIQPQQPQQPPAAQQPPPGPAHWQRQSQQAMSPTPVQQPQQPQAQSAYGPGPGQNAYGQQPSTQPQYAGYQQQPPPQQQQQQYGAPPQTQNPYARSVSPAPHHQHQQQQSQSYGYRAPSPQPQAQQYQAPLQQQQQQQMRGRTPSPQPGVAPQNAAPTGQWSTSGQPVLFYVKALYDYQAQSAAEFDFQAGDIIAVTNTPEDGWWSGELLDEARRQAGRTDFPSNFVCLF